MVATLYDWLLFFHILMAIIWFGGRHLAADPGHPDLSDATWPQLKRVKAIAAADGRESPQVAMLVRRLFVVSRVELAFLVLIVLDMVTKPFL